MQGTALGKGRLDVASVMSAVGGSTREKTAVIELRTPRQESCLAAVVLEKAWVKESVAFLRKLIGLKV